MIILKKENTNKELIKILITITIILITLSISIINLTLENKTLRSEYEVQSQELHIETIKNEAIQQKYIKIREKLNAEIENNVSMINENIDLSKKLSAEEQKVNVLLEEKESFLGGLVYDIEDERSFSTNCFDISEIEMLYRITEAEATQGNLEQKMNVARNIFNRVESKKFPNTIEGVIFQRTNGTYQYSPIYDKRYYSVTITDSTIEAVTRVLNGECNHDALYFMAPKSADSGNVSWFQSTLEFCFDDGIHSYYKEK